LTQAIWNKLTKPGGTFDEDPIQREAYLRALQGGSSSWQGFRDLHESASQAAPGLMDFQ
jgi:hypothetical protein